MCWAVLGGNARAALVTTDVTDMWLMASEAGWGLNLIQQGTTMFGTLFVYDAAGRARWYVASSMQQALGFAVEYTGDLYEATGPVFSAPFDAAAVHLRTVGTIKLVVSEVDRATLIYTVDGVGIEKEIHRFAFGPIALGGRYRASVSSPPSCAFAEKSLDVTILHDAFTAPSFVMESIGPASGSCTHRGLVTQQGRIVSVAGDCTCSGGRSGTFSLSNVVVTLDGMLATMSGGAPGCSSSRFAAVREAQ